VRIPITVVVYDLDGALLHVVERAEIASEFYAIEWSGTPRVSMPPPVVYARSQAGPSGFAMARTTSPDVLRFGSDGVVRHTLRLPEPLPMSSSAIAGLRDEWVEQATSEDARAMRRKASDEAPTPAEPYVVGDIEIDLLDRTWVREVDLEADPVARWFVYAEDRLLGYVELPAKLDVREIGADYVLGVLRDTLDVETIVRARLRVG
jgi:hypothetical protein